MKRVLFGLAALVLAAGVAAADDADILSVIPETSLVAVVTKNADQAANHWFKMAVPLGAKAPDKNKGAFDALIDKMPRENAEAPFPPSVDRKGPLAFVVVIPSLDVQGDPVAFILKVSDYKTFLGEWAKMEGAAAPEVTPDGTDVIHGKKDSTYAAQLGKFVAISPAEYVIRNLKADAEKNLATGKVAAIRKLMDTSDLAVYTNPDLTVKTFEPQINFFKTMMKKQMEQQAARRGDDEKGPDPKAMAKFMGAYIDTLLEFAGETDALCAGVKFSEKGAAGSFVAQPIPETTLSRLAAAVKPAQGDPLARFDGPFVAAATWDLKPELSAEVLKLVDEFIQKMDLPEDDQSPIKDAVESYKKMMACLAGPGGFVWSSGADQGAIHVTQIMDVVPGKDLAAAMREYMTGAGARISTMGSNLKTSLSYDPKIETYRGVVIDRSAMKFSVDEDKADEQTRKMLKMFQGMYGESFVSYTARVKDAVVMDGGSKDTAPIKATIDRILDGKGGNLVNSTAFAEAVSGLPEKRAALIVMSFEDLMKTVGKMGLEIPGLDRLAKVKVEKPAAIGMSVAPAEKGVVMDFNVPMQEMLNIRQFFTTLAGGMGGEEEGAQDGGGKNEGKEAPAK